MLFPRQGLAFRQIFRGTSKSNIFASIPKMSFSSSPTDDVLLTAHNCKRLITLNRPKALNALNLNMIQAIFPKLKAWDADRNVSMIVIRGAGEKAFCSGGDVLAVTKSARDAASGSGGGGLHRDFFREEYRLNHLIGTLSVPYVAFIDGITMGGGCGLSVHGRFRVATERTLLAMPETELGLFPDVGGSYFLSRLPYHTGQFLALTGYRLRGADVFHAGIATHFVQAKDLDAVHAALMDLHHDKVSEQSIDQVLGRFAPSSLAPYSLQPHLQRINDVFSADTMEEVVQRLQKDESDFANKQLQVLKKMSPTSMKVTLRQLRDGAQMSFGRVFTMEYRLTQRCLADHDFFEGVRAVLVDKDRNPRWRPSRLEDVSEQRVDEYFAPLTDQPELVLV